jgi:hypothetical protein
VASHPQCPSLVFLSSDFTVLHSGISAIGQRLWKWQPDGGRILRFHPQSPPALPLRRHRRRVRLGRSGQGHLPRRHRARCQRHRRGAGVRTPAAVARLRAPRPAAGRCRAGDDAMGAWRRVFRGRLGAHRGRGPRGARAPAAVLRPATVRPGTAPRTRSRAPRLRHPQTGPRRPWRTDSHPAAR